MSILRKPLSEVTVADLEALIEAEARETGELEFKGTLPFKPTKGQPETADRWIEKGDRVGDMARDEILAEIVAFANAEGGTLVIGLHETKDEPRRAERLQPLPNCEGLARRLLDATEDVIEPRLPLITVQALPSDAAGAGYVLFRVGKSLAGPHRLKSTRDFYVRRGERAAKMDVREIKDLTLELARTGDRIEAAFQERRVAADKLWDIIDQSTGDIGPFLLRVTAIPLISQNIPKITSRQDLWWQSYGFDYKLNGNKTEGQFPSQEFNEHPRPRVRAFISEPTGEDGGLRRLLQANGLIEFVLAHPRRKSQSGNKGSRIYVSWVIQMIAGVLCQIERLRSSLAWDNISFGMEIEIRGARPLLIVLHNDMYGSQMGQINTSGPVFLPQLEIGSASEFDKLIDSAILDLSNSSGQHWDLKFDVPWDSIMPTS